MEKTTEFLDAERDLRNKIQSIFNNINADFPKLLDNYFEGNSFATEEHLKNDMDFSTPKDFLVAVLSYYADNYGPAFCSDVIKRRSKKNTKRIRNSLSGWYSS